MSATVLSGVRVVDFTTGRAGGQATTVLADFGAEVTKVEPPTGDRFRAEPASAFWLRGKRSTVIDLNTDGGRRQARALANSADVVVVSGPPSRLQEWGLASTLREESPGLVHCTISGWGTTGPYAELPGYEGLVAAKAGRMHSFAVQLEQDRPVFAALPVGVHIASQAAVQGIMAALIQRQTTGRGATVEASLLQAMMPFDLVDLLASQLAEQRGRAFTPLRTAMRLPTLNYQPLRTSDGQWIQCGNLLEHLFYSFLDATDLLGELLIDERFQASPAEWSADAIEEVRSRMLVRMQERPASEWMQIFEASGNVAAEPILTTTQAMHHVDLVQGRGLVTVDDPLMGETTQIAPIAELTSTPAVVRGGAPKVGEHPIPSAESSTLPVAPSADNAAGRPLEGITIIDLSTIIAAPLSTVMLADLGARVIKVEPLGGDPFRGLATEGRMAVKTNAGKESICIDLKKPQGHDLVQELVASADVLVHNFRGDVPAKLGIDWDTLHALNPQLIWAVVNGYGPHGPGAKRPATHPVIGACSGSVARQAGDALTRDCSTLAEAREASRQIMAANESNPDPNTSAVAASAILLALFARREHGGQQVKINMQVANGWANGDEFLACEGKPAPVAADDGLHGLGPRYRLYPTADGWVFLAAPTDDEFARFCVAAECEQLLDPTLPSDALIDALIAVFGQRSASDWEALLTATGVGCVRADGVDVADFIRNDDHMLINGWAPTVSHRRFGTTQRWGPVATVDGLNPDYRPAPLAGEHTDTILAELGYSPAAVTDLRSNKIVSSEPV